MGLSHRQVGQREASDLLLPVEHPGWLQLQAPGVGHAAAAILVLESNPVRENAPAAEAAERRGHGDYR